MKPKIISSLRLFAVFPITFLTTDTVKDRIVIRLVKMFSDGGLYHFGTVDVDGTPFTERRCSPFLSARLRPVSPMYTLFDNSYT